MGAGEWRRRKQQATGYWLRKAMLWRFQVWRITVFGSHMRRHTLVRFLDQEDPFVEDNAGMEQYRSNHGWVNNTPLLQPGASHPSRGGLSTDPAAAVQNSTAVLVMDGTLQEVEAMGQDEWLDLLRSDVARTLGIQPERVAVRGLTAGSIVVKLEILEGQRGEPRADQLTQQLVMAVADTQSQLYTGRITHTVRRGETLSQLASLEELPAAASRSQAADSRPLPGHRSSSYAPPSNQGWQPEAESSRPGWNPQPSSYYAPDQSEPRLADSHRPSALQQTTPGLLLRPMRSHSTAPAQPRAVYDQRDAQREWRQPPVDAVCESRRADQWGAERELPNFANLINKMSRDCSIHFSTSESAPNF